MNWCVGRTKLIKECVDQLVVYQNKCSDNVGKEFTDRCVEKKSLARLNSIAKYGLWCCEEREKKHQQREEAKS